MGSFPDRSSVPRIPLVYDNLGDIAQRPAVIHDYLYSKVELSRDCRIRQWS
ncbi:DUF1353 domain-containing protein [Nitrosospira multiformis]|uniref:DUF1353 domain-containing protein n=1 Tax=Nitrosospira multiformis TaxID=1231 RepID=UPI003523B751